MIRKLALAAAASLALAPAALAQSGAADPRIQTVPYDPNRVYRVVGASRSATQIIFGEDEEIAHIAIGDSVAWETAAEGNVLFLKARERHGPTNMIVSTRKNGVLRNYNFELRTRSGEITAKTPDTMFQMRFTYPGDQRAAQLRSVTAQAAEVEGKIITLQLAAGVIEGPRNFNYTVQGASDLQPSEVSDNGRFTVLRFPGNQQVPTIFAVTADGTESVIPFDVREEFVVIHSVERQFRLRRGKNLLCIYNEAYQSRGPRTGTNTSSPAVERTYKTLGPESR